MTFEIYRKASGVFLVLKNGVQWGVPHPTYEDAERGLTDAKACELAAHMSRENTKRELGFYYDPTE